MKPIVSKTMYLCGKCKTWLTSFEDAAKCCQPIPCPECGEPMGRYSTKCPRCVEKSWDKFYAAAFASAEEIDERDYNEPLVFSPDVEGDNYGFFDDTDALLDYCEEEDAYPPEFVFCATVAAVHKFDLQWFLDEVDEAMDQEEVLGPDAPGAKTLSEALEHFSKYNEAALTTWTEDKSRKIYVDPERRIEIIQEQEEDSNG